MTCKIIRVTTDDQKLRNSDLVLRHRYSLSSRCRCSAKLQWIPWHRKNSEKFWVPSSYGILRQMTSGPGRQYFLTYSNGLGGMHEADYDIIIQWDINEKYSNLVCLMRHAELNKISWPRPSWSFTDMRKSDHPPPWKVKKKIRLLCFVRSRPPCLAGAADCKAKCGSKWDRLLYHGERGVQGHRPLSGAQTVLALEDPMEAANLP